MSPFLKKISIHQSISISHTRTTFDLVDRPSQLAVCTVGSRPVAAVCENQQVELMNTMLPSIATLFTYKCINMQTHTH